MSLRMSRPEAVRLDLTDGEWILVKRQLTAGERQLVYGRMVRTLHAGERAELDPVKAAFASASEYLLDWSVTDPDGRPVVIKDQPTEVVIGALQALPAESFQEIQDALNAHVEQVNAAKKAQGGANVSSTTSGSPA
jgi:hypothetical protein